MKDRSDRELEGYLEENLAAKWFYGFTLSEPTAYYITTASLPESAPAWARLDSPSYLPQCARNSKSPG
jgi:hypothetical protein